ncbi:hypothetical protein B4109_0362 [Geobacillus stearothermophilus]|uniref:Uncharacterized protein n=1 Tax=Geobacillus stearothermophilus TaxID=1422 RepID=A0A150MN79_GEOSE|nr:hypothetical protein B4109_0362 [Geobacillus stearothermophilus]
MKIIYFKNNKKPHPFAQQTRGAMNVRPPPLLRSALSAFQLMLFPLIELPGYE